ncbi:MAG TPA: malto-oligosyltrehalose synthase [Verrucomicrobiae bacterium]|nr:malto-oligosyltrehalose synthase [Verrucomicrobiae bacterium]
MSLKRIPVSTYRLQFNEGFRFQDALRLLDYFSTLGISDLYASPLLVSRHGSGHGYDVTDPAHIDPEIGSEEDFEALQNGLLNRGMRLLLDIVPNHMAASSENRWWMDVLENGAESAFASYFDIQWHPASRNLDGKILLPVLARPFGETLDGGELRLIFQNGKFLIQYKESLFPLAPRTYNHVLKEHLDDLKKILGEGSPACEEYLGILSTLSSLSEKDRVHSTAGERRLRFEAGRDRLKLLTENHSEVRAFMEANLSRFNGDLRDPASFCHLERLLAEQNYWLAYWQDANEGINYRRFFAISDLVGMRVEDPIVFEAMHEQIFRLIGKGAISGVRIDHIDGLRDPAGYLNRLSERIASTVSTDGGKPYVIVEKILAPHETLPEEWPVAGTTGYDYLNWANGIFVSPAGAKRLAGIYSGFTGKEEKFADILYEKKKLVMNSLLRVEMRSLGRQLAELAGKDRYARNILRSELTDALVETTACMDVYRTYVRNLDIPPAARERIETALEQARIRRPRLSAECFAFLREILTLRNPAHVLPDQREERLAFVMRWQQLTGPIVAKGLEDTALYVYYPLLSLNEVGGRPSLSSIVSREEFYALMQERLRRWPHSLNATSTHDTKRSEDIRARLNVLSEMPEEWGQQIAKWAACNEKHKQLIEGNKVPDANEEYLIYQTLIGLWPLDFSNVSSITQRLQAYLVKATREAMINTRWTEPNKTHESALAQFIEELLSPKNEGFVRDFNAFQKKIAYCGMINGLAEVLLKITCPGVPDFYQGSELWDFRLVDPDNRGRVDFGERSRLLEAVVRESDKDLACGARDFVEHWPDGRIKLHVIRQTLAYRRKYDELFSKGDFIPLEARGNRAEHVVAYLRSLGELCALTVVPRWLAATQAEPPQMDLREFWQDTALLLPRETSRSWRNIFTHREIGSQLFGDNQTLLLGDLLAQFPVAVLTSADSESPGVRN